MGSIDKSAISRRTALALGITGLAAPALASSPWPSRPVTLVVPFPPGGQADFVARTLQAGLQAALGQPVVVDNRGGGNGNTGMQMVMRAQPDGYTLLVGLAYTVVLNPHTIPNMPIDPLELEPVAMLMTGAMVLAVHPSVPARDITEFAGWASSKPDQIEYGSTGNGSLQHVAMELLRKKIGNPEMTHVPYRGNGMALQDFIAGRLTAIFAGAGVIGRYVQAGQARPIMVTSRERLAAFPTVPTAAEEGIPDFVVNAWTGLFAPKGTPREIILRVNEAVNQVSADPAIRERIIKGGDEPGGGTPEHLAEIVRRDYAMWGEVVRANNIRAD